MKSFILIIMLSFFVFGSSGFKPTNSTPPNVSEASCFDFARAAVISNDGEINLQNVDEVNWLTWLCEEGYINILYP